MVALALLLSTLAALAVLDVAMASFGVDSRDGIADDHLR